ncbi:MAG: DNA-3-methyladenine glycosylase 2 family protein [Verrucomicrobiota bacterium]|nr:DNA-3-methyladenine glycosylase 2 family protein [Verrucomicrobiota bacterium]
MVWSKPGRAVPPQAEKDKRNDIMTKNMGGVSAVNEESAARLAAVEPAFCALLQRIGPLELKPRRLPPFQALVHAVIFQQLSGRVANVIWHRFPALFPGRKFPSPAEVLSAGPAVLRKAGISRVKCSYIISIAEQALAGNVPSLSECDKLSDAEIISRLTLLNGVGRWTAEMFLIFNLGRPDVLPVHDFGVRRGFAVAFRKRVLPLPARLARVGARWAPYRTTAALYLWRAADSNGGVGWQSSRAG